MLLLQSATKSPLFPQKSLEIQSNLIIFAPEKESIYSKKTILIKIPIKQQCNYYG